MRTKEEIQNEFAKLCMQLGEAVYRKTAIEAQINHQLGLIVGLEQEARASAPAPADAPESPAPAAQE